MYLFLSLFLLPAPFPPSALASKLDRVPAPGFAPLPPLWCEFSDLLHRLPVESPWPSFLASLKPVQPVCRGLAPHCVHPPPPPPAPRHSAQQLQPGAQVWLFQWTEPGVHLAGSFWILSQPYLITCMRKQEPKDQGH